MTPATSSSHTVRFHIGAHKTATTYIQSVLTDNQGQIAANGAAYWSLEQSRHVLESATLRGMLGVKDNPARVFSAPVRLHDGTQARAALRELVSLDRTVILSEENIIGHDMTAVRDGFYPQARKRMSQIAPCFSDCDVEFWLCVRDYADFISSYFAEMLRHGSYADPDAIVARHVERTQGWTRLVSDVKAAFPQARFVLWRYEDFRALEEQILDTLSGLPKASRRTRPPALVRPSASERAIRTYLETAEAMSPPERIQHMLALEQAHPRKDKTDAYRLFDTDTADRLSETYAAEWARFEADPAISCLAAS